MSKNSNPSFLLTFFDNLTDLWTKHLSLAAIPPLRRKIILDSEKQQQFNRDIFIISMLSLSIVSTIFFHYYRGKYLNEISHLVSTFASYRAIDLLITILKTGVFFNFRGDVLINEQPRWKIQRILIGVLFNYIELTMWYTNIYYYLSIVCPSQFSAKIYYINQALHLSFSTITTVGHGGYSPNRMFSIIVSFVEAFTGIFLIALVIGTLISLLSSKIDKNSSKSLNEENMHLFFKWFVPVSSFVIMFIIIFNILGVAKCIR